MAFGSEVAGSVYHPRQPQQTPFYQLVQREAVYEERYQERYGFWRPTPLQPNCPRRGRRAKAGPRSLSRFTSRTRFGVPSVVPG
jgi:hypothetical protein